MKLTRFVQLQRHVQALGADLGPTRIAHQLRRPGMVVDPTDIAMGEQGLYYVDASGFAARVLLYNDSFDIEKQNLPKKLRESVLQGGFDNNLLIEHLPKIHLLECETLKRAETKGWPGSYRATLKTDGRFTLRYQSNGSTLLDIDEQVLDICPDCLSILQHRYGLEKPLVSADIALDAYLEPPFINSPEKDIAAPRDAGRTCASVLTGYQNDWPKISAIYQTFISYQCESHKCPAPDLANSELLSYLHTHFVGPVDSDPHLIMLRTACIYCHANERSHHFLKSRREYREYLKLQDIDA